MDMSSTVENINNIYNLIAFIVFALIYLLIFFIQKKNNKTQNVIIIEKFNESNEKIVRKLDELRIERNTIDLQSSMDIIQITFTKSMLKIMEGIRIIISENDLTDIERKEIIYGKVKNTVNTQYDDDIIVLSRIYHKNIKLSHYIIDLDRFDMITSIFSKINTIKDKSNCDDIIDYIRNKYTHSIQSAQLKLSK